MLERSDVIPHSLQHQPGHKNIAVSTWRVPANKFSHFTFLYLCVLAWILQNKLLDIVYIAATCLIWKQVNAVYLRHQGGSPVIWSPESLRPFTSLRKACHKRWVSCNTSHCAEVITSGWRAGTYRWQQSALFHGETPKCQAMWTGLKCWYSPTWHRKRISKWPSQHLWAPLKRLLPSLSRVENAAKMPLSAHAMTRFLIKWCYIKVTEKT